MVTYIQKKVYIYLVRFQGQLVYRPIIGSLGMQLPDIPSPKNVLKSGSLGRGAIVPWHSLSEKCLKNSLQFIYVYSKFLCVLC